MSKLIREVHIDNIVEGMILAEDILDFEDNVLLSEGIVLRKKYIDKMRESEIIKIKIIDVNDLENKKKKFESVVKIDEVFENTIAEAKEVVKDAFSKVLMNSQFDVSKIELIIMQIVEDVFSSESITLNLSKIKVLDDYLFNHSVNVSVLSIITGIFMKLNKDELVELGKGAILHDIGKAFVNQDILNKPSGLTDEEFVEIKRHSKLGYMAVGKKLSKSASEAILSHHERMDGRGYPNGLLGKDIHLFAKIVSIADVFDALTSDRIYGKKIDKYKAVNYILKETNTKFDFNVVEVFLKTISTYPVGLNVLLNTNEYGIIVKQNASKPLVRILLDKDSNHVKGYLEVDLSKNPSVYILKIDPKKKIMNLKNNKKS